MRRLIYKNDGFLKSEKKFFAVYAANQIKLAKGKKKITDDYEGAVRHWSAHNGAASTVPVDLFIPPHPLTILDGMLHLLGRIESGER